MTENRFFRVMRHPVAALAGAGLFALAALMLIFGGEAARARLATADDPVAISDQALAQSFNSNAAQREIRAALAAGDTDLARSFVELAAERNIDVDPALRDQVEQTSAADASLAHRAGRFVHGLWTGEPTDLASLAGTAVGDLFVFGDIRDAAREGTRYLMGEHADLWIFGLAGVGLAVTAATYVSAGAAMPERIGLSFVKAARRTGHLNPALAVRAAREAVKVEQADGLVTLAENAGRVETKAGAQAALDGLAIAERPEDMSRLARLASAKDGKTRAIIELLGRAAIVAAAGAFDLATWLCAAALALFGFVSSCKALTERMTQRYLDRRRMCRLRQAAAHLG